MVNRFARTMAMKKAIKQLLEVERNRIKATEKRCYGDPDKLMELSRKREESLRPDHVCKCNKQRRNLVVWAFEHVTGKEDPIRPDQVAIATWAVVG